MKPIHVALPFSVSSELFLRSLAWTWQDISVGIVAGLCSTKLAVDAAISLLSRGDELSAAALELATCSWSDPEVSELLGRLVQSEAEELSESDLEARWLFVLLLSTYEKRAEFSDPLTIAETVYAAFGYPPEVAPFVRYMPSEEPDLGSRENNERRLIENWGEYLRQAETRYGRKK